MRHGIGTLSKAFSKSFHEEMTTFCTDILMWIKWDRKLWITKNARGIVNFELKL